MELNISFVYKKDGKIKLVGFAESPFTHKQMRNDEWIHTSTINTSLFIQNLFNSVHSNDELREEIQSLGVRKK